MWVRITYHGFVSQAYPVWDIESVYTSFQDPRFHDDSNGLEATAARLLAELETVPPEDVADRAAFLNRVLREEDRLNDVAETLYSYAYMVYSADTANEEALKHINLLERAFLSLKRLTVKIRKWLSRQEACLDALLRADPELERRRFHLEEMLAFARHDLSEEEEDLAADLGRAGAEAWGRLQEAVTSHLRTVWEPTTGETKTLVELRQLASHPDREIRQRAYRAELELLRQHEIAIAAALNGVKGFTVILDRRRGWTSTLEKSALQSRVSPKGLEALIGVLEESLPVFQRYLEVKARALGLTHCAFYDLFAPLGQQDRSSWSWEAARDFILEQFASFSPRMADLARRAFAEGWIHARPQPGKVGGAYCISLPLRKVSRILCNFDGTFGEIKTLAHELGHAYHFEVLREAAFRDRQYPMTLAETASTFAETLVFEAAFQKAPREQAISLLENQLQDITQVCVDILSRFQFESRVMELRERAELSPSELCQLMTEAQRRTYGVGLDPNQLHPYMWAVKGHYYRQDLAFYNYPYAFGQLLSLILYERFRQEGPSFARTYDAFLSESGRRSCRDVVGLLGEDIESPRFWKSGIAMVERLIDELEARVV